MSDVMERNKAKSFPAETGELLRQIRKGQGKTLKEVADLIGTTPQTVQRLETYGMTMSLFWVEKICSALDVDPRSLFSNPSAVTRQQVVEMMVTIDITVDDLRRMRERMAGLLKDLKI